MTYTCYHCFQEKPNSGACPFCGYLPENEKEKYPSALPQGSVLNGKYIVGRVLGQGGFGITYIAKDYKTGERVAIKEYLPSEFAGRNGNSIQAFSKDQKENFEYGKEQFLTEAKTLAAFIGDEHIVRIYSFFEENNTAYFAMEYVDGLALDKVMAQQGGRLHVTEANRLLLPLMVSLSKVHAKGIVHRDIAPDNIIITKDGTAKLIDFGAARYSTGEKSRSLDVILKHGFAPPEQYMRRGRQGPFTDVYALAATYYYAITGKLLPDSVERTFEDTIMLPRTLGVKISRKQEDALLKALEVNAADRYQNMGEFYREMTQASGIKETSTRKEQAGVNPTLQLTKTEQEAMEEAERFERIAREAREKAKRLEQERREQERAEKNAREEAERQERERLKRAEKEAKTQRKQEQKAEVARKRAEKQEKQRQEHRALAEKAQRTTPVQPNTKKAHFIAAVIAVLCLGLIIFIAKNILPNLRKDKVDEEQTWTEEQIQNEEQIQIEVGSNITFGFYDGQPIEWQVLAKEEERILVISRYILFFAAYNESHTNCTWETCSLREELNDSFLNTAFTKEERAMIPSVTLTDDGNSEDNISDQVFLLSSLEADLYFSSDVARRCVPSDTIYSQYEQSERYDDSYYVYKMDGKYTDWWWLRSPGIDGDYNADELGEGGIAGCVYVDGKIFHQRVFAGMGVRPAIWIDLRTSETVASFTVNSEPSKEIENPSHNTEVVNNQDEIKELGEASVGDHVLFGSYEQDNDLANGKEPIEWLVLDIQENRALLLSRYALDCKQFKNRPVVATWDTSTIRTWLNSEFLEDAFNSDEQAIIPTMTVSADKNPYSNTDPGNSTEDQVFLLSVIETVKYFESDEARKCAPTDYAVSQGTTNSNTHTVDGRATCSWWTRSPNGTGFSAIIKYDGQTDSLPERYRSAVRPALWINVG